MNLDLFNTAVVTAKTTTRASASAGLKVRSDLKAGPSYSRVYTPGFGVYVYVYGG